MFVFEDIPNGRRNVIRTKKRWRCQQPYLRREAGDDDDDDDGSKTVYCTHYILLSDIYMVIVTYVFDIIY